MIPSLGSFCGPRPALCGVDFHFPLGNGFMQCVGRGCQEVDQGKRDAARREGKWAKDNNIYGIISHREADNQA